jgi:hypothetical protein
MSEGKALGAIEGPRLVLLSEIFGATQVVPFPKTALS